MRAGRINMLPIWVGAGLTSLVFAGVVWAGLSKICDPMGSCQPRWQLLANAPANELGDTLSGVGSVLAFIWVIVTVWTQSIQLQLQRRDIHAQQAESRRMTEATVSQARIYEQEQQERAEDRADRELSALVDRFLNATSHMRTWQGGGPFFSPRTEKVDDDLRFNAVLDELIERGGITLDQLNSGQWAPRRDPEDARQAALYLDEIEAIQPRLSRASQIWLTKFSLAPAAKVLDDLLAQPALWLEEKAEET